MRTKSKQTMLCAGLLLCAVAAVSANTQVTFQVDMTQAIASSTFDPLTQTVETHGSFNGWGAGLLLTNNPTGANPALYSGTINVAANGIVVGYKYVIESGDHYESVRMAGGHNRLITLPSTSGASFTAPQVYYGDVAPGGDITSTVTFQVNMAQQINVGNFMTNSSTAYTPGQTHLNFGV